MSTPTFTAFNAQARALAAPAEALSRLVVTGCEKVAALQMENLQVCMALGFGQLKAAMSIKDVAGLQAFVGRQGPLMATLGEKASADGQVLTRLATDFGSEVQKTVLAGAQALTAA